MRRKREGRGSEIKVQASLELGSGAAGWAGGARAGRHCTAGTTLSMGWTGREAAVEKTKSPEERRGRRKGRRAPPQQASTSKWAGGHSHVQPVCWQEPPSLSLPLGQTGGEREAPLDPRGKRSQLGACRCKGRREGEPQGAGACAGGGVTRVAGWPLFWAPRSQAEAPPSIAAGLKGKHEDRFGNGFCQFGTRERKGMGTDRAEVQMGQGWGVRMGGGLGGVG